MKVKYDPVTKRWKELPPHSKEGIYLDGKLKKKLDSIKRIIKENWDAPILIDGAERSGKSVLAMTIGYYLSNTKLDINNFCAGLQDAVKKIKEIPDKSVLIIDEGSLVFSSKDAMSKGQKQLLKILDVVGQKNLIMIIVLPSIFDLIKQVAVRRSRFLLHVYADNDWKRGRFCYFSQKRKRVLYDIGKKNFGSYAKPKANFFGTFTKFLPDFYQDYLELKKKSMIEALDDGKEVIDPNKIKTELIIGFKENCPDISDKLIAKGFGISETAYYHRKQRYKALNPPPIL